MSKKRFLLSLIAVVFLLSSSVFAEGKTKQLSDDLKKIERDIETKERELKNVDEVKVKLDEDISNKTKEIERLEGELKEREELLGVRFRAMYKGGAIASLDVLLSSENPLDFLSRNRMLKNIAEHDKDLIEKTGEIKNSVEEKKKELEHQKFLARDVEKRLNKEKNQLLSASRKKRQELETARKKEADAKVVANQKTPTNAGTSANTQVSDATYSGNPSGRLLFPVSGRISSPFGMRGGRLHKGIDITCPQGTPVHSAENGVVIRVGSNGGGYGNHLVISHGNGLSTLYAHNSKILVGAGDRVSKGQRIALSGNTGRSSGPHLHFETIVNGRNVNPISFFR